MLKAGDLRHRVKIQRPVSVQNPDTGELVASWGTFRDVWAKVAPLSTRQYTEQIMADAIQSKIVARITIRELDGVDATMRVLHRGKVYQIQAVLPDPESGLEYLTLAVSEGLTPEANDPAGQGVNNVMNGPNNVVDGLNNLVDGPSI